MNVYAYGYLKNTTEQIIDQLCAGLPDCVARYFFPNKRIEKYLGICPRTRSNCYEVLKKFPQLRLSGNKITGLDLPQMIALCLFRNEINKGAQYAYNRLEEFTEAIDNHVLQHH